MSRTANIFANAMAFALISTSVTGGVVSPPGMPTIKSIGEQQLTQSAVQTSSSSQSSPFLSKGNGAADPKLYGKTYSEWTAEWWKWAFAYPLDSNPVSDTTGEFCDLGQSGPVWFLAGSFGVTGVERTCTIPKGKAIFYPLMNNIWVDCPESGDLNYSDTEVGWIMSALSGDPACQLTSTLDKFPAPNLGVDFLDTPISVLRKAAVRTQSPVFKMYLPENSVLSEACPQPYYPVPMPSGKTGRMIGEGYWVMLPPLAEGEHLLTLHGAVCETNGPAWFENSVTYHLTVVPAGKQ